MHNSSNIASGAYDLACGAFTDCDDPEVGCTDENEVLDDRSVADETRVVTGSVDAVPPRVALAAVELPCTISESVAESDELAPISPITLAWLLCAGVLVDFGVAWSGTELVESGSAEGLDGGVSDSPVGVGEGVAMRDLVCKVSRIDKKQ